MNDQGAHQEPKDKALQEVVARLKDELLRLNTQLGNNLKKIKEFFLLGSGGKIIFDQDGSIAEVNQNFVEGMNAYSKERIIRSNIYDFFAENEKSILNKAVKKLLEKQTESTHLIATMKRSDGSFFDASISLTVFSDLDTGTNLVFASITNITSQLNLHFELEEKKKLLSEAQKLSQFGYWHYSFANRKIHWSDEVYSIFEARKTDELGSFESFLKRVHPSDHDILFEFWKKISLRSQIESITIRIIVGDGSVRYVTVKAEMETDRSGKPFRILGTIIDVTENWYREKKIAENEELFHSLFNNLTDIFIIFELVFDGNGTIVDYTYKDVNPLFEMKLGFVRDEVVGKRLSLHLPSLYQQLHPLFKLTAIASEPQQDRLYIPLLDSFVDVLIYSPSSNMIATIWRDVSLMVEAERSLRESEEKYRQIFSVASDALFMVDYQTGKIADTNPTACLLYGYRRDELLSMTMMDLSTAPDQLLGQISAQASILVSEVCVKKNGDRFPVEMSLSYFNWGGRKVVFVSVRDISERIASQEKLIKSELKFKQLFDFSNDAILILRNYRIIDYNQKASSIFDLRHGSLANKTLWSISPGYQNSGEDSRINAVELLQDTLAGNQHQIEWLFQRSDSSTFVADVKLSPILYGNEKVIQAIIRDITPQKETETALKKNEERWKFALEGSSIGVMDWDLIGNHIYFSPVLKSMLGFQESEMAHTFEEFEKRIHPDDVMRVFDYINEYLSGKRNHYNIEYRIQCKNGSYKWVWGRGKVASFTPDGSPGRFVGTLDDVTKTKIIEQNHASEIQKLKQTASVLKTGYWELDLRTMIFHGQPETFSILGFDPHPLHLKKLEKIVHPDDKDIFIAQFDVQSQRKGELLECFRIIVDDETRHIQSYVIPQFDQRSTLAGFIGAFQDISIHKMVEAEQIIKQNIYSALNEQLNFALIIVQNEQVVYSNKKAYEITGYAENELHAPFFSVLGLIASGSRDEFQKKIATIGSSKSKNFIAEYELITKHNRNKWVEVSAVSISFLEDQALLLLISDITQRKNKYLKSQNNESTYKAMVDFSNVGIALYNDEKQIVASNNRYQYFIGGAMSKQGAPSVKSENEAIILDVIEKRRQGLANVASNAAELSVEGEKIWVSIEAQYDPNKMLCIQITDIDQLKQSELAAMSDTFALRSLIDQSATAYALFDRKMELVFANRAFSKMFQPILNVRPLNFASFPFASHSDSVLFVEQYGRNELSNKAFVYSDYKEKHLTIGLSSYEVNQSRFFSLAVVDETVVQTEINNLKRNIEKYLSLFEASPLGMVVIDRNRNIINSNSAFNRLTGFTPNSAQLKRVDDFVHIENLSEVISDFSQLFSGVRKHINARHRIVSNEEKSAWIKSDLYTVTDSYGNIVFAVCICEDISELIEQERKKTNNDRVFTLQQLTNSMAHLFNNQFMSVLGSAYLLKSSADDLLVESYANNIINSIQRWSENAHKYLQFSSPSKHLHVLVDTHALIKEIRKSNLFLSYPNIKVGYQFDSVQGKALGDPNLLYTAIQTLLMNAVEALPKGGSIQVSTNDVFFERDELFGENNIKAGKYIRIRVADTGYGISTQLLPFIFDPFFSTKKNPVNPGLGLTLCKLLVDQMGGSIKIFSETGVGTEANIYMPVPDNEKLLKYSKPDEQIVLKGTANILVIDDEEIIRLITNEFLQKLGYNVFSFSSGLNAVKFYSENKQSIDLVLLDMQMPEMSGDVVFGELKSMNQQVKVILMSGFNLDERIEKMLKNGLIAFIQKPVSIEKLSQAITKALFQYGQ